jgi:hypothetical protein
MVSAPRISLATICLALLSTIYWVAAGFHATYRLLWYDELVTWHLSRLPDVTSIFTAIKRGLDSEMPVVHLIVRVSHAAFGLSAAATRLPMLIAFWVLILGLYVFLKRRLPWQYALIGAAFPLLTFAWEYAYEARAYAIILGCGATALVCWQNAAEGRYRIPSLIGITLALAVALACHPFAVILALPFGFGELVRTLDRRRIDWPVWVAYAAAMPVMLAYPALLASVRGVMPSAKLGFYTAYTYYMEAFRASIAPLLLAGLVACLMGRDRSASAGAALPKTDPDGRLLPRHEMAALVGFALSPLAALGIMIARHAFFFPRYGIPGVIGVSGLVALLLFRAMAGSTLRASAVLATLMLWFVWAEVKPAIRMPRDPAAQFREEHYILRQGLSDGRPLVLHNITLFLEADFYLDKSQLEHLYIVKVDEENGRKYEWQLLNDLFARLLPDFAPLRARTAGWREFSQRFSDRDSFLLHITPGNYWWYEALAKEGWRLTFLTTDGVNQLYEVRRATAACPSPAATLPPR